MMERYKSFMENHMSDENLAVEIIDLRSTTPAEKQTALEIFSNEFYQHLTNPIEAAEKKFADDDGKKAYCIKADGKVAGLASYCYYPYSKIATQKFYELEDVALPRKIHLSRFSDFIQTSNSGYVAEMDYSVITPAYRGLGIGRILFDFRLSQIISERIANIVFLLSRSPLSGRSQYWQKIFNIASNGEDVDPNKILHDCPYTQQNEVNYLWGTPQITNLAIKHNFIPVGFSKNLSPLWIKTLEKSI